MDNKKIGEFILKLRKEQKLTQDELAEKIPISRQAVSKWERGITIPDSATLLKLSEIFNVSINEILCGQKLNLKNKKEINNLSLNLYNKTLKNKKIIRLLIGCIILLFIMFLSYYFINQYNSIQIYIINGQSENFLVSNGLFIETNYKKYFKIDNLEHSNQYTINSITLFYKDKNNNDILIYSINDNKGILFTDYAGYNEYLPKENIKRIVNNLYLKIIYNDDLQEIMKLDLKRDYINNELIFKKDEYIKDNSLKNKDNTTYNNEYIKNSIKEKYQKDGILFSFINEDIKTKKTFVYNEISDELIYNIYNSNNQLEESYIYTLLNNSITYIKYENQEMNYSFIENNGKIECDFGDCLGDSNNIINNFWKDLMKTIN